VPGRFVWQKKIYASLSAIARIITGTNWNGPTFFGPRGAGPEGCSATGHGGMKGMKISRCTIYTRKSTEHSLNLEFNSLHA
jgi:hypothetical protein